MAALASVAKSDNFGIPSVLYTILKKHRKVTIKMNEMDILTVSEIAKEDAIVLSG